MELKNAPQRVETLKAVLKRTETRRGQESEKLIEAKVAMVEAQAVGFQPPSPSADEL